ncbi:MAG TPA: ABC transporter substrate-binding protein [Anaeromyxobacter sp.]|nr:ABC transporter substrate-binding protein [Anaeromyxobacter sp.]
MHVLGRSRTLHSNRVLTALAASALLLGGKARAEVGLSPVSVIVFPGGFNWPIWAAQEHGDFARGGIEVRLSFTPSSAFQLTRLVEGDFDVAMTAVDNVVAYSEGQGEAPVSAKPDLFAFMGGDNGLLSLAVAPAVKNYQDLRNRTLSVDAMTTGYAFVLFDLLHRNGLEPGDYQVVKAGGVLARWEALKAGGQDGTMLLAPFDILARSAGFNILQEAIDVYGHYQGLVGATRRSWARANEAKLEAYIRGYLGGLAWLADPANKGAAIDLLRRNLPTLSPELAEQFYDELTGPRGFSPAARFDSEGMRTVLALRSRYGRPGMVLRDPAKYYDGRYYQRAVSR